MPGGQILGRAAISEQWFLVLLAQDGLIVRGLGSDGEWSLSHFSAEPSDSLLMAFSGEQEMLGLCPEPVRRSLGIWKLSSAYPKGSG